MVMAWHLAGVEEAGRARGRGRPSALAQRVQCPCPGPARLDPCGRQVGASGAGDRHRQRGGHVGDRHPDEMVKTIRGLQEVTGGFGVVLGFAHDWANHEATLRSWDLFARYVIPEINGYTRNLKESAEYLAANKVELMAGLNAAIMAKVQGNKAAEAAMAVTRQRMAAQAQGSSWRPEPGAPATDADKGEK